MADQARWFKFWCSAPSDDDLQALPVPDRWAWAVFGAYTKLHGNAGTVSVSPSNVALAGEMGVTLDDLIPCIQRLPHMTVEEVKNRHGAVSVTWHNWTKYQVDSTVAERQRASRSKKRREEKREEEKRSTPYIPPAGDLLPTARELLRFLNRKAGRQYQPTKTNLGLIVARLRDGATADQCRAVIGRKTAEWLADPKMTTFLRPATLFNATKFAQYQGELPATAFDNGQPG